LPIHADVVRIKKDGDGACQSSREATVKQTLTLPRQGGDGESRSAHERGSAD